MKRKFLVVLLAIAATFCMAFGLAACGEKSDETGNEMGDNPSIIDPSGGEQGNQGEKEENKKPIDPNHTHAFSELYYDDIYHWRKCNICGERYEIVMHNIAANDVCTICGYKMEGYTKGLSYKVITKEGVVGCSVSAGKTKPTGEVVIPVFHEGLPVVSVGSFTDCKELTSVVIPNSVTSIGDNAFRFCSGLTSIDIPDSVTSIGDNAFEECSGLTSIDIPDSVTSIGESAFEECSGLTSINIPSSVTKIEAGVFEGCSGLTAIDIPDSVTSIGDYVFNRIRDTA